MSRARSTALPTSPHPPAPAPAGVAAGPRTGSLLVLPFQMTVNSGTCITYQVVAGQTLRSICTTFSASCLRLPAWIAIYSAGQCLLCLLPDINSLAAVTALGAATTLAFSLLATVGAAMHGGWSG